MALEDEFSDAIEIKASADRGITGRFEVTVGDSLVHSKATRGQGKCGSVQEKEAVIEQIRARLTK